MIGRLVLKQCLEEDGITEVVAIGRRAIDNTHPKLKQVIHDDFKDFSSVSDHFEGVDIVQFCLGVYTGAVSDSRFKEITVDFTHAFAEVVQRRSPQATFCFLSGSGADSQEKSKVAFAKYKGMAENDLISRKFGALQIFRPAYIYPVEKRKEPNLMYTVSRALYPLIKMFGKNASITSEQLAKAMFLSGLNPSGLTILENRDILGILENPT